MKTKALSLAAVFMLSIMTVFAAEKTEKFKVKGGEACKTHIEKAAKSVEGVNRAEWDKKTQQLEVVFDDELTQQQHIEMAIAKAGHDTENATAQNAGFTKEKHECDEKMKSDQKQLKEKKEGEPQEENNNEW